MAILISDPVNQQHIEEGQGQYTTEEKNKQLYKLLLLRQIMKKTIGKVAWQVILLQRENCYIT